VVEWRGEAMEDIEEIEGEVEAEEVGGEEVEVEVVVDRSGRPLFCLQEAFFHETDAMGSVHKASDARRRRDMIIHASRDASAKYE
jgi:hypothetical protein